jgi:hypothetical protein
VAKLGAYGIAGPLLALMLLACVGSAPGADSVPSSGAPTSVPSGSAVISVPLGQPFGLAIGQTAIVTETGLQVGFRRVLEDSRCPAQVNCVWAGRVTVELDVQAPNDAPETVVLSTCCPSPQTSHHVYAGQSIDLVNLTPGRQRPEDVIRDDAYRAEIAVGPI